ncbi:MAG: hypothetical protein U0797_00945 [Gemmataceae bacterium]
MLRRFNAKNLDGLATARTRPPVDKGGPAFTYTVLVPLFVIRGELARRVTDEDTLEQIYQMLTRHFGCTMGVKFGAEGGAEVKEMHRSFEVVAAVHADSDLYFRALRRELEAVTGERHVWIDRREIVLV